MEKTPGAVKSHLCNVKLLFEIYKHFNMVVTSEFLKAHYFLQENFFIFYQLWNTED